MRNNLSEEAAIFSKKMIDFFHFKRLNKSDLDEMATELIDIYKRCSIYLDKKFLQEICSGEPVKVYSSLWEIMNVNSLLNNPTVNMLPHSDDGPDWRIKLDDKKEYYIEATSAHLPIVKNSEICRVISEMKNKKKSSFDGVLINEVKSRITNVIHSKIIKHADFLQNKNRGYILTVSYGGIPFYASCDLYEAVKTILPIGPLTLKIDKVNKTIHEQYLAHEENFKKPSSGSLISTNIFGTEKYNWISAILFSKVEPCLLLKSAEKLPGINWNGIRNDFVLVYNPAALYPLQSDIFSCRTKIIMKDSKLSTIGDNIFPAF